MKKSFVNNLKERLRVDDDSRFVRGVRSDPEFAQLLNKLDELVRERDELMLDLRRVDLDIDACLVLIQFKKEKADLASRR